MRIQPRRVFAATFVVTVATAMADPAPKNPAPVKPKPPVVKKPPAKAPLPTGEHHWYVSQRGKECFADQNADACPPPPDGQPARPCNPPPPTPYKCSDAKGEMMPFNIVQYAGEKECFVARQPTTCPPNIACNPPPPKKVGCPK